MIRTERDYEPRRPDGSYIVGPTIWFRFGDGYSGAVSVPHALLVKMGVSR